MNHCTHVFATILALATTQQALAQANPEAVHARFGVTFSEQPYAEMLSEYVNADGLVNYTALAKDRERMHVYTRDVAGLYVEVYDSWSDAQKIAFLLNAYNALTLRSIVDHYPIKSDWKKRLVYPVGIRHIPDVWSASIHTVKGSKMSLEHIEHEMLRKDFVEPRIHMALVCAAKGCPPLRREPYTAERLNEQLDDQTRAFLGDPLKFKLDQDAKTLRLSPIFKWFAEDFAKKYAGETFASWTKGEQNGVLVFLSLYLEEDEVKALKADKYRLKYLDYDWSLNDQASE